MYRLVNHLWLLLHGKYPQTAILMLIYGVGCIAGLFVWFIGPGDWNGLILAFLALDWTAGIVANAAQSTRAYYAELPLSISALFLAVHIAEMPLLWWLAGGTNLWGWMQLLLAIKLAVFVGGQIEMRRGARHSSTRAGA